MKYLTATAAILGLSIAAAAPVHAQNVNANNLVSVKISDVANEIAEDLDVSAQDLADIGTVQVPVGVAANVCDVDANVLAQDNSTEGAACDATSSSQALAQIVQRQLDTTQQ